MAGDVGTGASPAQKLRRNSISTVVAWLPCFQVWSLAGEVGDRSLMNSFHVPFQMGFSGIVFNTLEFTGSVKGFRATRVCALAWVPLIFDLFKSKKK